MGILPILSGSFTGTISYRTDMKTVGLLPDGGTNKLSTIFKMRIILEYQQKTDIIDEIENQRYKKYRRYITLIV